MKAALRKSQDDAVDPGAIIELELKDTRPGIQHRTHDQQASSEIIQGEHELGSTDEDVGHTITESEVLAQASSDSPVEKDQLSWWRRLFSPGVQLYLLALLMGALMQALSKLAVQRVSVFIAVQVRMVVTLAFAFGYMWARGVRHGFWGTPEVRSLLFLRGFLGFLNISMTFCGLLYLPLPDIAILGFLNPMFTGILSRIILHENYVWQQLVCGLAALLGVVIISRPNWIFSVSESAAIAAPGDTIHRLYSISATLVAVVASAVVMIIIRKIGTRAHPLASVTNYSFVSLVGSTLCVGYEMLSESADTGYPQDLETWLILATVGSTGFVLQFMSAKAIQLEQASILSSFKPTELIWMIVLEVIIWRDLPDIWTVAGGVVILGSVSYAATFKKEPREMGG